MFEHWQCPNWIVAVYVCYLFLFQIPNRVKKLGIRVANNLKLNWVEIPLHWYHMFERKDKILTRTRQMLRNTSIHNTHNAGCLHMFKLDTNLSLFGALGLKPHGTQKTPPMFSWFILQSTRIPSHTTRKPTFPTHGHTQIHGTFIISEPESQLPMANGQVLMGGDQWSPDSTQNTMVTANGWLHASRESIDKVQEQLPVPMTLSRFSCCYVIFHKSTMKIYQLGFQKLFWRSWVSECKDLDAYLNGTVGKRVGFEFGDTAIWPDSTSCNCSHPHPKR